ncbi:DUF3526 domain-containing protein [Pseudoflavitalea sp. G-6-1-2]|uniref:DUF3526 domain-containing protein n=1 Tax=Pseudoflavitalea sp. G-6-1-2 TaxID=2728841 RepID=UPI00146C00F8|nr:DUF3526 domain-containing protein [Pseudoflavitalea sp. G-6-1-2]NML22180.1 DUF3526 domain-containing protein [Pseudoflavitalea sp. G-6-1-2]
MFRLQFISFLRSRLAIAGLMIILLTGCISIFTGRQHLKKQQQSVAMTELQQQQHIQRNVQFFQKEMGLLLYYLRFGLANETSALNALSMGQRDVNSGVQSLTIRGLENQRYDTDLFNPASLLAGNLDFNFVLIYLFPLLIVAFTYNLLSEEKELGTWKLVSAQSSRPVRVLWQKLLVRIAVVAGALVTLLMFAAVVVPVPIDAAFFAAAMIALMYLLSWFAISGWIVSLGKNSNVSAAALLGIWIMLVFVVPGAVNNFLVKKYAVPEAMATVVEQREGYHEKWDMDQQPTLDKFYRHYPQFKKYGQPDSSFSWLWYYAMQQLGDDDAREHTDAMYRKLHQREDASASIARWFPSLHAQHQLNSIAGSGLRNQLLFLQRAAAFHEQKRLFFYPLIFDNAPVKSVDWHRFGMEYFSEEVNLNWLNMLLPFVLTIGLFTGLAWWRLRKSISSLQ